MATKISTHTTYEAARTIEPIYTGGDVSNNASGSLIATTVDEDVLLVQTSAGVPVCRIEGDGEAVTNLCLSPDASHIVVCSRSLSMRIYALSFSDDSNATADLLRTLKPHTTPVVSSAIDSTGFLLATGGADGTVKVWDLRGGYISHTFHPHGGVVSALSFSHDGTKSSHDPAESARTTKPHQRRSSDLPSILLASGGEDGKIKIHNLNSRRSIATLDSHVSVVRSLEFSKDSGRLLSSSRDRTIILWSTKSWNSERVIPALEVLETAGFFDEGRHIYAGGENGVLRVWSGPAGREITSKQRAGLETDAIVNVIPLPKESVLVTIHQDQSFRFYSYANIGTSAASESGAALPLLRRITGNHDEVIDMACVGPRRSLLALATNTESIKLVSIKSSEPSRSRQAAASATEPFGSDVALLEGHKDIIICLDVDWSGYWLATGAKDNVARLWRLDPDSKSFGCVAVFEGHAESLGAIALPKSPPASGMAAKDYLNHSPAFLLTGSQDKTIKRWDMNKLRITGGEDTVQSGFRALYTRVAHEKDINALDASATAPLFASASQDKTIKIWSLEDGSVTGILRGHKRGVWSVSFSPAGTPPINLAEGGSSSSRGLLVSGSGDRTVKVWSLSTYACLLTFEGHSNAVLKVMWIAPPSPNGEGRENGPSSRQSQNKQPLIASASSDTLIKLWTPYASADSDHLLTTLDNHTDRVWALASPQAPSGYVDPAVCPYPLITGAADATVTFWRDTTKQTATQATERTTERIEQDQLLQNPIHAKNSREVITLSLALNHPARLLKVFQDVVTLPEAERDSASMMGVRAVDDVLASLDEQQVFSLLERVRDWNTNARTATVAQRILNCLLKSYPASFFTDLADNRKFNTSGKGVKDLLRALEVYTDRHYKRMEELVDESYLLEYTLREMDEVTGTVGGMNGVYVNGHSAATNGDVLMT